MYQYFIDDALSASLVKHGITVTSALFRKRLAVVLRPMKKMPNKLNTNQMNASCICLFMLLYL